MTSGMPRGVRVLGPVAGLVLLLVALVACAAPATGSAAPDASPTQVAGPTASSPASVARTRLRASAPSTRATVTATPRAAATAARKADAAVAPQPTDRPAHSRLSDDDSWEMVKVPRMDPYNDAVIENSAFSTQVIKICRDWGTTSCRAGSPVRRLRPGQNSRTTYGWTDTDGYDHGRGWVKQHGCFRCTVTVTAH